MAGDRARGGHHVGLASVTKNADGKQALYKLESGVGRGNDARELNETPDFDVNTIDGIESIEALLEDDYGIFTVDGVLYDTVGLITHQSLSVAVSYWNDRGFSYNPFVWHTDPPPRVGNNCYAFRNFLMGRFQLAGYDAALPR